MRIPSMPGAGQLGFTLLEIIVVVLLIAISTTFVLVNLERDRDAVARLETERFASLVRQARDESIISGRPYAVFVDPDNNYYEFREYRAAQSEEQTGEWAPMEDDDIFRRREIPVDLNVIFELLGTGESGLLIIEGLGDVTPFNFMIEGDHRVYAARLDDNLNVAVRDVTPD